MHRAILYALLSLARARADVIVAVDAKWTLSGDTSLVRRGQTQLGSYCAPPSGHEQDVALLAQSQGTAGVEQMTLHFTGGAVVVYGAVLTSGSITEPISYSIDGSKRQQSAPGVANASLDPKSGAACDIPVVEIQPLALGPHVLTFYTGQVNQQIAVYNATVFDATSLPSSTRHSTSPVPKPPANPSQVVDPSQQSSSTKSSQAGVRATSQFASTDFVSAGSVSSSSTPPETGPTSHIPPVTSSTQSSTTASRAGTQGTITEPNREPSHRRLAIALPCALVPAAMLLVIWLWRKYARHSRRNSVSPSETSPVQPYLESSRQSPTSIVPSNLKGFWNSDSKGVNSVSEAPEESQEYATNLSASVSGDTAQIIAIHRAVREAGFSTQALLESLDRVRRRECPDPTPAPISLTDGHSSLSPPRYEA